MFLRRKLLFLILLFCCLFVSGNILFGGIVFSEIMYHPSQGEQYEYIELANDGGAQSISGWSFSSGIRYTFPQDSEIPAGGRIIVCQSKVDVLNAYPDLDPSLVFGNWEGMLDNAGDTIVLSNSSGTVVEVVSYDDDSPWDFLPDGFGPSLERVCLGEQPYLVNNWHASPIPEADAFGGTPLDSSSFEECPPPERIRPGIRISEIMYHPVLEEDYNEHHEFIEITNIGGTTIDLENWKIVGGIDYLFPAVSLDPGNYLVIAYDREALLTIDKYGLDPAKVIGDYGDFGRELDNGSEKVGIVTADGVGVDSVTYQDNFPWPAGADAFGVGEDWLPNSLLPLKDHQYMGRSLERVSLSWPSNSPANWLASPVDGATPGRQNTVQKEVPLPVVEDIDLSPVEPHPADLLLRASDDVKIEVRFSDTTPVADVNVDYFVEDLARTNETHSTIVLKDNGEGPDAVSGDMIFSGIFPRHVDKTIIRYRIIADRGSGQETVSPRDTDPYNYFSYYVSPVINTETKVYEIYVSSSNWGRMYSFVSGGRVSGCNMNPTWNNKVPAVFIYKGKVYDVFVRYQGSRWNRTNGASIGSWPYPRPSSGPFTALSWHIKFPRYDRMEGLRIIVLNKLTQGCPGFTASVGFRLFEAAGIPAPLTQFIRFHVNGGYYRYMLQLERPGEEMMKRWFREQKENNPGMPEEPLGHLFKSVGCNCDEGPFGWGDERRLLPYCGWTALERYEHTYAPKINKWAGGQKVMDLIEEFNDVRSKGIPAVRSFFEDNFDMDLLLNYMSIINWIVPFDDMFQNHFLYQRGSDGKWFIMPWDLDRDFGGWQGANSSIYMGEVGDTSNRSGWVNYIKDSFLKAFRPEFEKRLRHLNNTILNPEFINPLVDQVLESANPVEAAQAASRLSCSFSGAASAMKSFTIQRHTIVDQRIPAVLAVAGEDLVAYVGKEVQFDASSSRPDPGDDVTYSWSNGMKGMKPVYVFDSPGDYEIKLTITSSEGEASDTVNVTVLELPDWVFPEKDGVVVIEAESFHQDLDHSETECWWEKETTGLDGYSGQAYMQAAHTSRQRFYSNYIFTSPELRYFIKISTPGSYRLWVRAYTNDRKWDSLHVGIDGKGSTSSTYHRFVEIKDEWQWSGDNRLGPQVLDFSTEGLHYLSLWIRESGIAIDKLILTRDMDFTPEGMGPEESEEKPFAGDNAFVRGDISGDGKINLSDPIQLLKQLFSEPFVVCEDRADGNDDGSVNIADALYILQYLFVGGPEPPAPFPAPGFDPTEDQYDCGDPSPAR